VKEKYILYILHFFINHEKCVAFKNHENFVQLY